MLYSGEEEGVKNSKLNLKKSEERENEQETNWENEGGTLKGKKKITQ